MTLLHASFSIERTYKHAPARVFRAFAEPATKERWFRESKDTASRFALDFRIDGRESSLFYAPHDDALPAHIRGSAFTNETVYHDIRENERIVFSYRMACNGETMSVSLATVEIAPAEGGARLTYTEQGVFYANADGPEMRTGGWNDLLDKLGAELDRRAKG
jgi:uncharacterized protein YndB with AHSA1/START domain